MVTSSNLYAEKVFAEHPIALWALDDQCDYISLITEAQRSFSTWTNVGGISGTLAATKTNPFPDTTQTYKNNTGITLVSFESPVLFSSANLDPSANTFSVGFYLYYILQNIQEVSISYKIGSGSYVTPVDKVPAPNDWSFVSNTFTLPVGFFDLANTDIRIKITITFNTSQETNFSISGLSVGQQAEEFHSYSLGITPITIPTNIPIKTSKGIVARAYGENVSNGYYLVNNNKILAKNNSLPLVYGAKNLTAITPNINEEPSLIIPSKGFLNQSGQYGTYTLEAWIRVSSYTSYPKRILGPISSTDGIYVDGPFLTLKVGQYSESHYINEWYRPMLLHICYSPSLISLLINGETVFSINVDAENLSFPKKTDTDVNNNLVDQDWIGIYSSTDVPQIEIDCLGIYPYKIPPKVAKRRWVFGQAVDFPENINTAYSGKSVYIDYPFANYSKNYLYPDIGKWNQGLLENISTEKQNLSPKTYSLPRFVFQNQNTSTESIWFKDLSNNVSASGGGITMKPNTSWSNIPGYMYFSKLNVTGENISAIYGVFQIIPSTTKQTLIRIEDQLNGEYLSIEVSGKENSAEGAKIPISNIVRNTAATSNAIVTIPSSNGYVVGDFIQISGLTNTVSGLTQFDEELNGQWTITDISGNDITFTVTDGRSVASHAPAAGSLPISYVIGASAGYSISYKFKSASTNNEPVTLYKDDLFFTSSGNPFYSGSGALAYVGINFNNFANTYGYGLSKFLGNRERLSVYVAGNKNFEETFNGYVYRVGFCTPRNFNKISSLFHDYGIVKQDNEIYNTLVRDGGNGLSPTGPGPLPLDADGGNTYTSFTESFFDHIASYTLYPKMNYESFVIDVATDSYWEDYVPLSYFGKNVTNVDGTEFALDMIQFNIDFPKPVKKVIGETTRYQTDNAIVKTYVSFQDLTSNPFSFKTSFANTSSITSQNQVITPGSDYTTTRYEVVNGSVIKIPSTITDFNDFAIVIHVEMVVDGINTKPVKIKKIQLAGNSFGSLSPGEIGTRFGQSIFPYKKEAGVYKYDLYNSFAISKFTKPYLYLTRDSGIQPLTTNSDRGISVPINSELSPDFSLSAIQMSFRLEDSDFESGSVQFAEIDYNNEIIKFFFEKIEAGRARITYTFTSSAGIPDPKVVFYLNGNYSPDPLINISQWEILGIGFIDSLDFNQLSGNFNITYPIVVNNISYFEETVLQKITAGSNRQWFGVKFGLDSDTLFETSPASTSSYEWGDWKDRESVSITSASIDGANILYNYTGSKVINLGEYVSVTGLSISGFNIVNKEVIEVSPGTFKVANTGGATGTPTASSAKAYTFSWLNILILSPSTYFGVDLGELYSSYTGTNRFSAGDSVNLSINRYQYSIYQDVNSVSKIIKPL
jgi:hypothetical protein